MNKRRTLDRSRDYAEVIGVPGVLFSQDGYMFNGGGEAINPAGMDSVGEKEVDPTSDDNSPIHVAYEQNEHKKEDNDNNKIEQMHWHKLKILVESYGGIWSDRATAIKFLKGGK